MTEVRTIVNNSKNFIVTKIDSFEEINCDKFPSLLTADITNRTCQCSEQVQSFLKITDG